MKTKLKYRLSIASFICSICFGVAGFVTPPTGIIDSTVLWFIAQLLMFTSSMLGIEFNNKENKN